MQCELVKIGKKVRILYLNYDEEEIVYLTDNPNTNYLNNAISLETPLGKTINGGKEGETFSFKVGDYVQRVKILEVM